jgi:hypothetical protein
VEQCLAKKTVQGFSVLFVTQYFYKKQNSAVCGDRSSKARSRPTRREPRTNLKTCVHLQNKKRLFLVCFLFSYGIGRVLAPPLLTSSHLLSLPFLKQFHRGCAFLYFLFQGLTVAASCPVLTSAPASTTKVTVPERGAETTVSIFIALSTKRGSPFTTLLLFLATRRTI